VQITRAGWYESATPNLGPTWKQEDERNAIRGVVLHSAEGFHDGLLRILHGPLRRSWHFSILFDGTVLQHYPVTVITWHGQAANAFTVGIEHEGTANLQPSLTQAQVESSSKLVSAIADFGGFALRRPFDARDSFATLWEHNELTRFGSEPTACPSRRIPWNRIMEELMPEPWPTQKQAIAALFRIIAAIFSETQNLADLSAEDKQVLRWLIEVSEA